MNPMTDVTQIVRLIAWQSQLAGMSPEQLAPLVLRFTELCPAENDRDRWNFSRLLHQCMAALVRGLDAAMVTSAHSMHPLAALELAGHTMFSGSLASRDSVLQHAVVAMVASEGAFLTTCTETSLCLRANMIAAAARVAYEALFVPPAVVKSDKGMRAG